MEVEAQLVSGRHFRSRHSAGARKDDGEKDQSHYDRSEVKPPPEVPRWWKAFTIRPNPLELSHRFRYILPIHPTHRGCPETLILQQFSRSMGPWQRIPSLSATLRQLRENPVI